ncbi:MAG: hypothetical protein KF745_05150 [Phycisphaeraceae bacterium]|nr:hypothetical protein [Phycisphaeraceae bacterium]
MQALRSAAKNIALTIAAGAAVALSSCGRSDEPATAIRTATTDIKAAAVGGSVPVGGTYTSRVYTQAVSDLKPAVADGSAGQASAANLITARAHAGVGVVKAEEAAEAMRRAMSQMAVVRAGRQAWLDLQGLASSLELYDPTKDIQSYEAQISEKSKESAQVQAERKVLEDQLASLESRIREELEKARAERELEAGLRRQAELAGASQRATLIEQANRHKRTADGFEKQAAIYRTDQGLLAPQVTEFQASLDRLATQSRLLNEARNAIVQAKKNSDERAAAARADAIKAAQSVNAELAAIAKTLEPVEPASSAASQAYGKAAAAAKQAGQSPDIDPEAKTASRLAAASMLQAQGDVLAARARGLEEFAALLATVANTQPPFQEAPEYTKKATETAKQAAEAREAAAKAYQDAKQAFESAGGKLDQARLARISASLEALAQPGSIAPPDWLTLKSVGVAAPAARSAGSLEGDIRAVFGEIFEASKAGHWDRLTDFIAAESAGERAVVGALQGVATGYVQLDAACRQRFGKDLKTILSESQNPIVVGMMGQFGAAGGGMGGLDLQGVTVDDLQITVVSDTAAKVGVGGDGQDLEVVKVSGAWKLRLPAEALQAVGPMAPMIEPIGAVLTEAAADVNAGKFQKPEALVNALTLKIMSRMNPSGGPDGG